ncbi:MAG: DUF5916 domain-containing protein [Bradymonadia bacterium]
MKFCVMTRSLRLPALSLLVCSWPLMALSQDRPPIPPEGPRKQGLAIPLGDAEITLDGRLDEAIWQKAAPLRDFEERVPVARRAPPADTEIRVLYGDDALYVGARMYLMAGDTPRAYELRRDAGRIFSDDAISLKFDVRQDFRTVLGFAVNPGGAQLDYIALDNGQSFRTEYDMVWDSATAREKDAWTAEFRIPYVALGGVPESARVIGFNATRDHNARNATDDWAHMPPEFGAVSALHFGELKGVPGSGAGQPLAVTPYVLVTDPGVEDHPLPGRFRVGGDARLSLSDQTWLELTALTDFAQVDLDDTLINLDRFPLFFPERRPFFINGLDVFDFGLRGTAQLFFSRRIGLDANGDEVPLYGGLKLFGREGKVRYGLLNAVTAETEEVGAANWSVGRARVEVGDGHIGVLAVSRQFLGEGPDASGQPAPHVGAGLDFRQRAFDTRLEVEGFGAVTATTDNEGPAPGAVARGGVRWRGRNFRPRLSTLLITDTFDPEVGFVFRRGVVQNEARMAWVHWTEALGLQRFTVSTSGQTQHTDELDQVLLKSANLWFDAIWQSNWGVEAAADYVEDVVLTDFELAGRTVRAGTYSGPQAYFGFYSPSTRNPGINASYRHVDGFFGGTRDTFSGGARLYLSNLVGLNASINYSRIDLPDHDPFTTLGLNSQLTLTPSPTLSLDTVGQVNTVSEELIAQVRLRWRYLAGSDLFLVYRERYDYEEDVSEDRRVTLKATWRTDMLL